MKQKPAVTQEVFSSLVRWERGTCQISFEILLVEGNNNELNIYLLKFPDSTPDKSSDYHIF